MSSQTDATPNRVAGRRDLAPLWEQLQGQVARSVVADPEIFYYWLFLASNRARVLVTQLADALEEVIIALPDVGTNNPQADLSALRRASEGLQTVLQSNSDPTEAAGKVSQALDATLPALRKQVGKGTRLRYFGDEAASHVSTARAFLRENWDKLRPLLAYLESILPSPSLLMQVAMRAPSKALQEAVDGGINTSSATEDVLNLVAGVSSVKTLRLSYSDTPAAQDRMVLVRHLRAVTLPDWEKLRSIIDHQTAPRAVQALLEICSELRTLSADARTSGNRLQLTWLEDSSPLAGALLDYSPTFSGATRSAGKAAILAMRTSGFDNAYEWLLTGQFYTFFAADVSMAARGLELHSAFKAFADEQPDADDQVTVVRRG